MITNIFFLPDFDAIDELSGNLGGLSLPPAQASSTEYGSYLHKNPAFRQMQRPRVKPVSQEVRELLASQESYMPARLSKCSNYAVQLCMHVYPKSQRSRTCMECSN